MANMVAWACVFGRPQVSFRRRLDGLGITVVETITIDHNILCQTVSDSLVDCLVSGGAAGPERGGRVLLQGVKSPAGGG